jgi:hypothetical protein
VIVPTAGTRDHATAVLVVADSVGVTVWTTAVNCADWPSTSVIESGATDTEVPGEGIGPNVGEIGPWCRLGADSEAVIGFGSEA